MSTEFVNLLTVNESDVKSVGKIPSWFKMGDLNTLFYYIDLDFSDLEEEDEEEYSGSDEDGEEEDDDDDESGNSGSGSESEDSDDKMSRD